MIAYYLLCVIGIAIIVAAFNQRKLVKWENRVLIALADAVREKHVELEEEDATDD